MLLPRLLSAIVGIPIGLLIVLKGGLWFTGLVLLLALIAFHEFAATLRTKQIEAIPEVGFPAVAALVVGAHFFGGAEFLPLLQGVLAVTVMGSLAFHIFCPAEGSKVASASATALGVLYIGFLFTFFILVREMPGPAAEIRLEFGLRLFLLGWLATWGADTGAYAAGKTLGRHKLCPSVSPGKTVEGAVGGLLGALLVASWVGYFMEFRPVHILALGALAFALGLIGDLSKSIIKRDIGVKDFGSIIPGHGGVLDRFDSMLINLAAAYFFALAFMR